MVKSLTPKANIFLHNFNINENSDMKFSAVIYLMRNISTPQKVLELGYYRVRDVHFTMTFDSIGQKT